MNDRKLTIYLAGKVGGEKHDIARANTGAGVTFICSDGADHSEHRWGVGCYNFNECQNALEYHARVAIYKLHFVDMLFAYLDTPDSFGSIAEIAYFSALGKPALVTVRTSGKDVDYDRMFDAYWFVCCFPGVRVRPVDGCVSATAILDAFLGGYHWGARRAQPRPKEEDIAEGMADAEEAWQELTVGASDPLFS